MNTEAELIERPYPTYTEYIKFDIKIKMKIIRKLQHLGEHGLFGDEEIEEIIPAIEAARGEGIAAEGPIAPDTVFLKAVQGAYDIVVAMYHDQGHIPLKLLVFDSGVNITVGLDVIRTSVDHGTAFDIADKLIAKEDSLLEAIKVGMLL